MSKIIRVNCGEEGTYNATVPDGWRVVVGKSNEYPKKDDKAFDVFHKTFTSVYPYSMKYATNRIFKLIRRIHRKKKAV